MNDYESLRNAFSPWITDATGRVLYRVDAVNDAEAALMLLASLPSRPIPAKRRWWKRLWDALTHITR